MKTTFSGYKISMVADAPEERRTDRAALKAVGADGVFRSELAAQLELSMSGLDESRFYVAKTYAVQGVL